MKKLWLASIDDTFNPQKDILMGPWCLLGNEHYLNDYQKLNIIPDPFQTPEELSYHEKITSDFALSYMPKLSDLLNDINKSSYSEKFWHTIAFNWLLHLVASTWEKQLRVNYILKKYNNDSIEISLIKNNISIEFKDTKSFFYDGIYCQKYNEWIFSRLLENNLPNCWHVKWNEGGKIKTSDRNNIKLKYQLAHSFSRWMPSSRILGIGRVESIFWSLLIHFKKARHLSEIHLQKNKENSEPLSINLSWRKLITDTMPKCFKNIGHNPSELKKLNKRIYFIGSFPLLDEKLKLKIAKKVEKGVQIITTQHGSHYGTAKVFPIAPYMEYNQYAFFSWGWRKQEDYKGNIIDLPSPFLSGLKHTPQEDIIIFVSMGSKPMPIRIYANPQPIQQIESIYSRLKFISAINKDIRKKLLYRPYVSKDQFFKDPGLLIKTEFPNLKIMNGKLQDKLLKCKLLILDHPGTTLNIALASNIPTICLWNPDAWAICRQAESYFMDLKKSGILFSDPIKAATHVNDVFNNVQGWWDQRDIQIARKNWTWQFARTSNNWRKDWIKAIWSL